MNSYLSLQLVVTTTSTERNDARLRELKFAIDAASCAGSGSGGGCSSPVNAKWYEFFCPSYGQN
jgi:hypothetical protein